ncbi:MAG: MBL fold metallo-hydrolase [Candidatus Latescibacteria bacterium]|nr:MBL fold metallo-hydrolase [Candidatus Latescibacterota bacterium]
MPSLILFSGIFTCVLACAAFAQESFERDVFPTAKGELAITFIGHASLIFEYGGMVIHVDPVSREADYSKLPEADIIFVTHEHSDHMDPGAIAKIVKDDTVIVATELCAEHLDGVTVMKNGDTRTVKGLTVEAVPAYNIKHKRGNGQPFHPKGAGNGYVVTFADTRVYIGADTENIPEMKALSDIDIAFLPMNLPYTMTPEMVADAARMFNPAVLYPYHFGETDTSKIVELLKGSGIDVRIRKMP